jgi:hypothetical protein
MAFFNILCTVVVLLVAANQPLAGPCIQAQHVHSTPRVCALHWVAAQPGIGGENGARVPHKEDACE